MRKLIYPLLFLLSSCQNSCQKRGEIKYFITNNSSSVLVFNELTEGTDTIKHIINPGTRNVFVAIYPQYVPPPRKLDHCPCFETLYSLTTQDTGKTITKSMCEPSNWNKKLVKGKFATSPDYTVCDLEINESDIQ